MSDPQGAFFYIERQFPLLRVSGRAIEHHATIYPGCIAHGDSRRMQVNAMISPYRTTIALQPPELTSY